MVALVVVLGVVSGISVLVYLGYLATRYFHLPRYPDEIHFARTSDGWRVAVLRYRALHRADGRQTKGDPIRLARATRPLCHAGLSDAGARRLTA